MDRMDGKVCVVTGALGSIGSVIARQLAARGATVVLVHRDAARVAKLASEIAASTGNARLDAVYCDLGSLASVRQAAAELARRHPRIDVLVNNAATFSRERTTTRDGYEKMIGINHLAPFLLTLLLEEPLARAGNARVVCMTMPSGKPVALDDLGSEKKWDAMTAFTQSKGANHYFVRELAERWQRLGISVNALNPRMTRTTLIAEAPLPIRIVFALFAASPEKGADTAVWLASSPEVSGTTGGLYEKRKPVPFCKGSDDPNARRQLWAASVALVGLPSRQIASLRAA